MSTDARVLAAAMGELDDDTLARLLAARRVGTSAPWRDLFDAAEALLAPASVEQAVSSLTRPGLAALAAAAGHGDAGDDGARDELDSLGLLRPDGRPFAVVSDVVRRLLDAHPDAVAPLAAAPAAASSPGASAAAAERAWQSTTSLADIVVACLVSPPARTGAGTVTAADRRRMLDAGLVESADDLEELLDIGHRARLMAPLDREWIVTDAGEAWLTTSTRHRWQVVAEGLIASLPSALRTPDGAWTAVDRWPAAVPLDPQWPVRAAGLRRILERWGVLSDDGTEPAWTSALRTTGRFDLDALAQQLPPEIDRIYLQADLTAIAPGVLAPELDLRLRTIARRESRAQASTYRFTDDSLAAGIADGETGESIREFLSALSLTGIPQPLDYLIERAASRYGQIVVRADAESGRTRVESDDPRLLETVSVDQALRSIGLVADGSALASRVSRDAVYWTLADARYPVIALDAAGRAEPVHRRRVVPAPTEAERLPYGRLIERLRGSQDSDADAAWLGRELDAAVRARATIVIVVALPDGEKREFTIEATGLGGGRLRGRDRGADTERTLPVSSIVSVRAG